LISLVDAALSRYDELVRGLSDFAAVRYVGRARLEVSAIGLAIHIVEHGQRHAGQMLSGSKLAKSFTGPR
jgi:hypothetical protein